MVDPAAPIPAVTSASRAWPFWVSIGLWVFAAWQIYLLTPYDSLLKRFGVETPTWTRLMLNVPAWAPIVMGALLALLAYAWSSRRGRVGLTLVAFLAAFAAHWSYVSAQIQMHRAAFQHTPVAARP